MITDTRTKHTRRYRGVSVTRVIDAAKGGVAVERLAAELTTLKGANEARELTGRCPLPDHEDRTPSFTVNPEKGVFYCHGCGAGGDVIDLAQAAWSIDRPDVAAAELLLYFGLEVPKRLPAWFRKRERQKPIRDGLDEVRVRSAQRRLMRTLEPLVASIADPAERREEAKRIWHDLGPIARMVVGEVAR